MNHSTQTRDSAAADPTKLPPEPPNGDGVEDPHRTWPVNLFKEWSGLITTAGAVAGALATYQLAKDIGKGDLSSRDQLLAIVAIAVFAVGVGLLITIPVSLRTKDRVMIADAVEQQRRINAWNSLKLSTRQPVIPSSSLFGYRDLVQFEEENLKLIREARAYWMAGRSPLPELVGKLRLFREQRAEIEDAVGTRQLRTASASSILRAGLAMVLTVAGFSTAALITNKGIRAGEVADSATAHARTLEGKLLDDRLKATASVVVTFPSTAVAASVWGVRASTIKAACRVGRKGTALKVEAPPKPVPPRRMIYVAFPKTRNCSVAKGWVELAWLR